MIIIKEHASKPSDQVPIDVQDLKAKVKEFWAAPNAAKKNRIGTLLGNKATADSTKTLTHTLWGLYNVLPAHSMQQPHRYAPHPLGAHPNRAGFNPQRALLS